MAWGCTFLETHERRQMTSEQTILVVEDESEIREGIRILLGGEGYTILEAADGRQALEYPLDDIDLRSWWLAAGHSPCAGFPRQRSS